MPPGGLGVIPTTGLYMPFHLYLNVHRNLPLYIPAHVQIQIKGHVPQPVLVTVLYPYAHIFYSTVQTASYGTNQLDSIHLDLKKSWELLERENMFREAQVSRSVN